MESECYCPACLKPFQQTNKLLCGHVFCSECVSKTETLARKTNTEPACPICLCDFTAASEENPHPNSPYHDVLVSRSDPKNKKECVYCDNEPTLFCKDGCGLFCEECQDIHSKIKKAAAHKVLTLLEAGNVLGANLSECILHNLPIISISNHRWPVSEMCFQCAYEDLKPSQPHGHMKIEKIEYETIKEEELISIARKKVNDITEKKEKVDIEMKKITRELEEQLATIENFYNDIVQKATQLKAKLTETVQEAFRPKSGLMETIRHRMQTSENILKHSIAMLKEAKEIYQREEIVTKLFKSAIFAKKVIELDISDVEPIDVKDMKEVIPLNKGILIDEDGAHLLDEAYETMKSQYENFVQEIDQLKKANEEWQKQIEEKDAKLKNAGEIIHLLENEVAEHYKVKEKLAQIEKEKEQEQNIIREREARKLFNRTWKFDIKNYKFDGKIGSSGNGNLQFSGPWAIAVHPKTGHLYIAEDSNHRVQVLDENMNFIRVFGSNGSGPGQFNHPRGISISLDGPIAVCECGGNRIQVFDEKNTVIATIQSGQKKSKRCTQTTEFDGFSGPYYICFDVEGNLYVANYSKNRVDKFNRDFEFENSFAQSSLGDTGILSPHGICMNSRNEVCVIGYCGDKINFYDTNGTFIRTLKIQKASYYVAICEGPNNTILVSDWTNQIRAYDATNGTIVHTFGSSKSSTADGQFYYPSGTCFGLNQKLYVCEYNNHRIQAFST